MRTLGIAGALITVAVGLTSCGIGSAGVSGLGSSSGGGTNTSAVLSGFAVEGAQVSPATLRFTLADAEGDMAEVELVYQVPGEPVRPIERIVSGIDANPGQLAAPAAGAVHRVVWDYAAEPDLPANAAYVPGVSVWVRLGGGEQDLAAGVNGVELGLGNDAPLVTVQDPSAEVAGVVPIRLVVSDSSRDVIRIRAEFDVQGDEPDQGWRIARPAGIDPRAVTPAWAFDGVVAPETGAQLVFFWDTDLDLAQLERDVRVRFTPVDAVVEGAPAATGGFRVDNNAQPVARILDGPLLQNQDELRGIPIPFELFDEEADRVRLVFQWRLAGESFPALPAAAAEIEALLADPALARSHRICSEYPHPAGGRLASGGSSEVMLPELAGSAAHLIASGLEGRELALLRPASQPRPASAGWSANPLQAPVAALPLERGVRALVLDAPGAQAWSLVEVELASGTVARVVAGGPGAPSALAAEPDGRSVLVASELAGAWRLARVSLESGAVVELAAHDGSTELGTIRGLASIGRDAAVLTVASSLVRVDYPDGARARARALLEGLALPWGVVLDPLAPGRVYVAERDGPGVEGPGRVLAVELASGVVRQLVVRAPEPGAGAFPRPRALALTRGGSRLLALCDVPVPGGPVELRGVDLGGAQGNVAFVFPGSLPLEAAALAAPDDVIVVTLGTTPGELLVGGGVEQVRTIAAHEPGTGRVALAQPFDPPARAGQPWSLETATGLALGDPAGRTGTFLWDGRDAGGGQVFLRVTPLDADAGIGAATTGAKNVRHAFELDPLELGGDAGAVEVVPADMDGDGDLDLVAPFWVADLVKVFWQTSPGEFDAQPLELGGPAVTDGTLCAVPADLDGDGDLDIVSANFDGNTITVFWQIAPGVFDPLATLVAAAPEIDGPGFLDVADLDGDGNPDIASTSYNTGTLAIFWQRTPGVFDARPAVLGAPALVPEPRSIRAADADADGDVDLAVTSTSGDFVAVFWQTSPGGFDPLPTVLGDASTVRAPIALTVADVDLDGDLDLVSASLASAQTGPGSLALFWQTSPGTFATQPTSVGELSASQWIRSIAVADVDLDGLPDLIASASQNAQHVLVFRQLAAGTFAPTPVLAARSTERPNGVAIADVDGDGAVDLVAANWSQAPGTSSLALHRQLVPGAFRTPPIELQDGIHRALAVADIDGDGARDIAAIVGGLQVLWQTSPAVFEAAEITVAGAMQQLACADLDGDVDLDLVGASASTDALLVLRQSAPRVFDPPTPLGDAALTDFPSSVAAADIDGDGQLDLVSTNAVSNTVTAFRQVSGGVFDQDPLVIAGGATVQGPSRVDPVDIDADGDVDLVVVSPNNGRVVVLVQQAPGAFAPITLSVTSPSCVATGDVDGDGRFDVAVGSSGATPLMWFRQTAAGAFEPPRAIATSAVVGSARDIVLVDIDRDGDLDVASLHLVVAGSSSLAVFRQLAPGGFGSLPTIVTEDPDVLGLLPFELLAEDVDLDGDLDLLLGGTSGLQLFHGGR